MDKDSILASLTGGQLGGNGIVSDRDNTEQDLFGDIGIHEAPSLAVPTTSQMPVGAPLPPETNPIRTHVQAPAAQIEQLIGNGQGMAMQPPAQTSASAVPPAQTAPPIDSLLSKSGLLGATGIVDDSGGLFDDVDKDVQKVAESNKDHTLQNQEAEPNTREENQHSQFQNQQQQQIHPNNNSHDMQGSGLANTSSFTPANEQHFPPGQSVILPQSELNNQMNAMALNNPEPSGFYREHSASMNQKTHARGAPPPHQNSGGYYYGTREQQIQHPPPPQQHQFSGNFVQPSTTAGMHNTAQKMNLGRIRKVALVKPQEVPPLYIDIRVTEPMLIQTQSFLISSPPYWSYQITSQLDGNQGTWLVRRRFRHVVALEDRLRQACPGSILPPRPEKHATRALEEASTQQSAEFAVQRSKELALYLNQVARHPVAGQSQVFRLFLGLQDDIGTAWPEVSPNALTRLQAVGAGVTMKVAESTNLTASSAPAHEWEEDAELLGLCSSENLRLGAVAQSVPKLEGTVIVLREQGDAAGILGMELSKASKMLDMEYKFFDTLSSGLLRNGRRTKRLALEMSGAMNSFIQQYKLVRYEKMAMQDRRHAIQRKAKERGRADARAVHLSQQQRHLQVNGQMHHLNHLEQSAITMDTHALDAVSEADEIGTRLKLEINRVAIDRRTAWNSSIKTIARSMKEACSERRAIWESTLEAFENLTKNEGHP